MFKKYLSYSQKELTYKQFTVVHIILRAFIAFCILLALAILTHVTIHCLKKKRSKKDKDSDADNQSEEDDEIYEESKNVNQQEVTSLTHKNYETSDIGLEKRRRTEKLKSDQ